LAKILHEPVEHGCLPRLRAPTQKQELRPYNGLSSSQTRNSGSPTFASTQAASGDFVETWKS
jgi:hypothetical protein